MTQDNVVGNFYDKYATKNRISAALVGRFLSAVTELYQSTGARSVLEVGCGEGKLADHLVRSAPRPERFLATDLSLERTSEVSPEHRFFVSDVPHRFREQAERFLGAPLPNVSVVTVDELVAS